MEDGLVFSRIVDFINIRRFDLAEAAAREILRNEQESPGAWAALALALQYQRREPEASDALRKALSAGPDDGFVHYVAARVSGHRNDHVAAERSLREAMRADPDDPHLHALLARSLAILGRIDEARDAVSSGLELDPEHVDCLKLHAFLQFDPSNPEASSEIVESALRLDPADPALIQAKGQLELLKGNAAKAEADLRESVRLNPNRAQARDLWRTAIEQRMMFRGFILKGVLGWFRLPPLIRLPIVVGIVGAVLWAASTWKPPDDPDVRWFRPFTLIALLAAPFILAKPILMTALRFEREGRSLLRDEEIFTSNMLCAFAVLALTSLIGGWINRNEDLLYRGTAVFGILTLMSPSLVVVTNRLDRAAAYGFCFSLFGLLVGAVVPTALSGGLTSMAWLGGLLFALLLIFYVRSKGDRRAERPS